MQKRPTKGKSQSKGGSNTTPPEPTPPVTTEDDEIIRCVCGEYEEEEDVERDMICCDKCLAWQHNDCMGLKFAKGKEPDEYYCEQCKPENHKVLLEKIARGERPWEEVAKERERLAQEKKSRKRKGGKRGRKPRASEVKAETASRTPSKEPSQPFQAQKQPTPAAPTPTPTPVAPAVPEQPTSQKRKFEHQEEDREPVSLPWISPHCDTFTYSLVPPGSAA